MTGSEFSEVMLGRLSHSVRNADRLPRRESEQPAVSTIEVTIGRIEVRGPAAPESRRAISQPAQAATLDEYLRRRSGQSRQ
jgi:hypothetical protein